MKKPPKLDVGRLHERDYLTKWIYLLANRHPEDPQLGIVLGFMAGKLSSILERP